MLSLVDYDPLSYQLARSYYCTLSRRGYFGVADLPDSVWHLLDLCYLQRSVDDSEYRNGYSGTFSE
jgi:hypothetical protein